MKVDGFDWDRGNWPVCARHGLTRAEIESVFVGELTVFDDPDDRNREPRFKAIGYSISGQPIFVVFRMSRFGSLSLVRPISARYLRRKEVRYYECETDGDAPTLAFAGI
ncbi:MAG: hypothetical protein MnENMB40S_23010 [Rhizobiaceae bacterium MnEN-MB40S]|nr:MAG: hypothetical protein MnENMB40S_23010 [Rhizobiaceae bacterium MnEN-MB40S]